MNLPPERARTESANASDPRLSAGVSHLVLIVPGIRDRGGDWNVAKQEIEAAGFKCVVVSWGEYFGIPRFLVPAPWFRRTAMRRLEGRILDAIAHHTDRGTRITPQVSFIAHSFGSYILCYLLRRKYHFRVARVILCGSVLPRTFPFSGFADRFSGAVINDVGCKDRWPYVASCVTFGYGTVGTYGYGNAPVLDRFHSNAKHDDFSKQGFATKWWVPVLKTENDYGIPVPSPNQPLREGPALRSLAAIGQNLKWLVLSVLLLALVRSYLPWAPCELLRVLRITENPCVVGVHIDRFIDASDSGCRSDGTRYNNEVITDNLTFSMPITDNLTFSVPIDAYLVQAKRDGVSGQNVKIEYSVNGEHRESRPRFVAEQGSVDRATREVPVNGTTLRIVYRWTRTPPSNLTTFGAAFISTLPILSIRVTAKLPPGKSVLGLNHAEVDKLNRMEAVGCSDLRPGTTPKLECTKRQVTERSNEPFIVPWVWDVFDGC